MYVCMLRRVLVAAHWSFVAACGHLVATSTQDLVSRPGIKPGPPAMGAQSLTQSTTREVPNLKNFYLLFRNSYLVLF